MLIKRTNSIYKELNNFKVVHGWGCNKFKNKKYSVPDISKDIKVIMISDYPEHSYFINQYMTSNKIDFSLLQLMSFNCWIDKIKPLLSFIKSIDNKYILYLDCSDTVLVSDILYPEEILKYYNCKILFNAEDNYSYPGHPCDPKIWLQNYPEYYKNKYLVDNKNMAKLAKKINTNGYTKSLNAGVFLGERLFLISVLEKILKLMLDNPAKGYPYGESDDQILWQYIMSTYKNNEIEIDYYNLFFLWTHDKKFSYNYKQWEHFNYFNNIN